MLAHELGDVRLLLGMGRNYSNGTRRIAIETFGDLLNDPFGFESVHITLVNEIVMVDRIEFDNLLYGFAAYLHHLQAIPVEVFRGKADHFRIGAEVLLQLNGKIGDRLDEIEHAASNVEEIYLRPNRVADIRIILGEGFDEILHEGDINFLRGIRGLHVPELVPIT